MNNLIKSTLTRSLEVADVNYIRGNETISKCKFDRRPISPSICLNSFFLPISFQFFFFFASEISIVGHFEKINIQVLQHLRRFLINFKSKQKENLEVSTLYE
ncbi:hypothetical protein Avbf_06637 [Armadillidium vulgare]|nr:hypothetical protein Avbf_06637 [Armadillidium vulgare]